MLAMDIPMAVMTGMIFAEAGKGMIKSGEKDKNTFLTVFVFMYGAIFFAPTPVYYFLGWPAWECNFLWEWVDHIYDSPLRAAFSYVLLAVAVLPTYLGLVLGRFLIRKGKDKLVRIGYVALFLLVGVIILLMNNVTFNVAATMEKWRAGETYSFWTHPFVTGWAITATYYWGSLAFFYFWIKRRSTT